MRRRLRPVLALALAIALLGVFAAGLAAVLDTPRARPGASRAERIYIALCAECHGADGRGSVVRRWAGFETRRDPERLLFAGVLLDELGAPEDTGAIFFNPTLGTGRESDQYLADIIRHGGAPIGRPGMPAFGEALKDEDIRELVTYLRGLARARERQ